MRRRRRRLLSSRRLTVRNHQTFLLAVVDNDIRVRFTLVRHLLRRGQRWQLIQLQRHFVLQVVVAVGLPLLPRVVRRLVLLLLVGGVVVLRFWQTVS
jgi:hypothetical protein